MNLFNENFTMHLESGVLKGLYKTGTDVNLVDKNGNFGRVCYTYVSDDITKIPYVTLTGYQDRLCQYDLQEGTTFTDTKNRIATTYELTDTGLLIHSKTDSEEISQFGLQLDFNFMSKKGTCFQDQYMPSTFYTSDDGRYMYCIMISPKGKCIVVVAQTPCDGWKLDYSPFCAGHFILGMKFLASFDKQFKVTNRKEISVRIQCTDSLEEAFEIVYDEYRMPMLSNVRSGGFDGYGVVALRGEADSYRMTTPSGKTVMLPVSDTIRMEEYGIHSITPVKDGVDGLGTSLYNGCDLKEVFTKCCDAIGDYQSRWACEGSCHLWAMLVYMNTFHNDRYRDYLDRQLPIVMGEGELIEHYTIAPFATDMHEAYHVYHSDRIQGQFFWISILLEAYKYYRDTKYLDFAINTLDEALKNNFENGKIVARGVYEDTDYTTVCVPVIAIVEMAVLLEEMGDPRTVKYKNAAIQVADHLYERGLDFPTEGAHLPDSVDKEWEDGSISCTAASLMLVYYYIKQDDKYLSFAGEILQMHTAWTIHTPDARQYQSSFRFWETCWEGDALGPATCAGHAWTIWRAEALFYYGLVTNDQKALQDAYNGFITNFAKIQENGDTFSCFEPDFIKGGGWDENRNELIAKDGGADIAPRFAIGHSYPKHPDRTLPLYAWARAGQIWFGEKTIRDLLED